MSYATEASRCGRCGYGRVAKTIVGLAEKPRREVIVGNAGRTFMLLQALAPGLAEGIMARQVDRQHVYRDKPAPSTPGNLFELMPEYTGVSGGWQGVESERMRRVASTGLAAIVPAFMTWRWYQRRRAARQDFWGRLAARVMS